MARSLALESKPLLLEVHGVLSDLDPSRWRDEIETAVRQRLAQLQAAFERVLSHDSLRVYLDQPQAADVPSEPLIERLNALASVLREEPANAHLPADERRSAWQGYRKELQTAYESASVLLRQSAIEVPTLRPTNYVRSISHMLMSVGCVLLVEEVMSPLGRWLAPLLVAAWFWSMEGMRHFNARARAVIMWVFGPVAHPHEHNRINSSTWFATGLTILGAVFEPMLCAMGVAVLGFADPAAGTIGRKFGRTKLVNNRSLEGSTTFAIVGTVVAWTVLRIWHPELQGLQAVLVAASVALAAAVAELFSRRIDDNMSVPLAGAAGGWIALQLLA